MSVSGRSRWAAVLGTLVVGGALLFSAQAVSQVGGTSPQDGSDAEELRQLKERVAQLEQRVLGLERALEATGDAGGKANERAFSIDPERAAPATLPPRTTTPRRTRSNGLDCLEPHCFDVGY